MKDLAGKVAVVTGAGSGIGRALAVRLADEGARLALVDVDADGLRRTAEAAARSPRVTTHIVDVSDRPAVEALVADVVAEHGVVDVVVANAGVACMATVEDSSYDDFEWVLGVNLWGVIHVVKAFVPLLRSRPAAHVVTIASVAAFVPFPTGSAYSTAKWGVAGFSQTLAMELAGTNVAVSCVYPGGVRTAIARSARHATADDAREFERRAMTSPDGAARVIVRGIRRGRERILVGADARVLSFAHRVAPQGSQRLVGWVWRRARPLS